MIIFIVSSMVILGAWMFFMPQPPPPATSTATGSGSTPEVISTAGAKTTLSVSKTAAFHATSNIPASSVTIETDDYTAIFSNQGAVLTSFHLKKFENRQTHEPIELVNSEPNRPLPFALT
jgi:YidC/Oxa1 family membrane protein insertase